MWHLNKNVVFVEMYCLFFNSVIINKTITT